MSYISFKEIPTNGKTHKWEVVNVNHGEVIGTIKWNWCWRGFSLYPEPDTVWSPGCMIEVIQFIDMQDKKKGNHFVGPVP